ncbi:TCR/Tet family MFS transporter [Asticcacaulis sp. BYS171W]|uniref:TCR/Tet family MFS transporter n=1 Tax=Asticcacaulis aquaticus TaxID=2984212 RepID=A0ABT5HQF7_9CAUL|nr:TCR/Tet family MFS transporter [Asticcacaulis aquaticus]
MSQAPDLSRRHKAAVPFIFVTVCLDIVALGLIIPVLPSLIADFVGDVSRSGYWLGLFGSMWGLMQFFASPVIGALSDRFGRRPVVLLSNFGLGADYLLMALAPGLGWLLLGRLINGITSASISTAYAYISDVTAPENRAKYFGLMGAAFGVGFVLGPLLGGVLGDIEPRLPFYVAAGLSLLNFVYGLFVLPESLSPENRKPFSFRTAHPLGAAKFLMKNADLMRLALINLTVNFAHSALPTTFVLYAALRFNWGAKEVGWTLAGVGICSAVVQALLTGRVVKAVGEKKAMLLGLTFGVIGFLGYGLAPTWQAYILFVPLMSLWGLAGPSVQALMTSKVAPQEQGTLQGANMSLMSTASIFAPIVFGAVFAVSTSSHLPLAFAGACFVLASAILCAGLLIGTTVKAVIRPGSAAPSASMH